MRRYVTDAGDLLPRLHKLVRSDCTTRNKRRAAALAADLRLPRGADRRARGARRSCGPIRPDLDGNAIMELLGIAARPARRPGLKHLLALRMEHGPLDREEAEAELFRWAAEQGIERPDGG